MTTRTVGQVAELVGVSVRTLHHWDELGVVVPSERSSADYRLYTEADIKRLHQVLLYRESGMPLSVIKQLLDDASVNEKEHLLQQRDLLKKRISQLQGNVAAIEQLIRMNIMGKKISAEERAKILGDGWDPAWEEEAEERWGHTEDWKRSQNRVSTMDREDWMQANRNVSMLESTLAEAFQEGIEPGTERANELAEMHRDWLTSYTDASHSKQVLMARLYTEDERFAAYYNDRVDGLAEWLRDVIEANAIANGIDLDNVQWQ